ncbi:unnamed protein product [Mytilus coruscus]|uniref:Mutator-like transposase domain-containing protein n=1 Tax=Mytilus coruscus TaxID=42192 RepID=A0A6J8DFE8_MYTCO|nr:unnamed protein product [Mytilus coruscus]
MVVNIPEKYCILLKNKCLEFLWNNKPPLVAYDVIINKVIDGGLNFPDIMQKMYAFRLKYLSRLFDENYCAIWKQTCLYFFSKFENMNLRIELLFCDLRNRKIDVLPEFYQSMILSWQNICENVDIEVNSENVFDIPLFLNPNITNCNKMLYLKTFIQAGVCKIKDIAYECKPGFLKESYIQEIVSEKFPEVSENKILHAVRNVLETLPDEYKVLVEANVHQKLSFDTSPRLETNASRHFDVNVRAVWGALASGNGLAHLNEVLATLDSPTMSQNTFTTIENEISQWWKDLLQEDFSQAIAEEKKK